VLDEVGWSTQYPGLFAPEKETQYPFKRSRVGPGPFSTAAEHIALTGFRSTDSPARSESLYRLRCPGPRILIGLDYMQEFLVA
jgi:hypothetical protein